MRFVLVAGGSLGDRIWPSTTIRRRRESAGEGVGVVALVDLFLRPRERARAALVEERDADDADVARVAVLLVRVRARAPSRSGRPRRVSCSGGSRRPRARRAGRRCSRASSKEASLPSSTSRPSTEITHLEAEVGLVLEDDRVAVARLADDEVACRPTTKPLRNRPLSSRRPTVTSAVRDREACPTACGGTRVEPPSRARPPRRCRRAPRSRTACRASARTKGTVVMRENRVSPHSVPRPGRFAGSGATLSRSSCRRRDAAHVVARARLPCIERRSTREAAAGHPGCDACPQAGEGASLVLRRGALGRSSRRRSRPAVRRNRHPSALGRAAAGDGSEAEGGEQGGGQDAVEAVHGDSPRDVGFVPGERASRAGPYSERSLEAIFAAESPSFRAALPNVGEWG